MKQKKLILGLCSVAIFAFALVLLAGTMSAVQAEQKAFSLNKCTAKDLETIEDFTLPKALVKAIIDYYGADRFTAIDPSKYDEALAFLDQYEAGEDPFAEEGEAEEEGSEDDDGVV